MKRPYFMSPREKTTAAVGERVPMLTRYQLHEAQIFPTPPEFRTWGPMFVGNRLIDNTEVDMAHLRLREKTRQRIRRGIARYLNDNRITAGPSPTADQIAEAVVEDLEKHGPGLQIGRPPKVRLSKRNAAPGDTITLGPNTYTFRVGKIARTGEILIGATAADTAKTLNALVKAYAANVHPPFMPTPTPKKPKHLSAEQLSDHALRDAVEFAAAYGNVTKIAAVMTKITGESVTRQMVGRWLNSDPKSRPQPSLGNAILLIIAVDVVRGNTDPSATNVSLEIPEMPDLTTKKKTRKPTRK